jgi:6-pyruvoyltetrahydropterin/6-carboxytetrahydropterin synthase
MRLAQRFREDAFSPLMGEIKLEKIVFSEQVMAEWSDPLMWQKLLKNEVFVNPKPK